MTWRTVTVNAVLPPPGAVTVIVVDERGAFASRWMTRELIDDRHVLGMVMQELVDEMPREER